VTIENVPAYAHELDATVEVDGFGEVRYDLAFGGNFYAILPLDRLGIPFDRAAKDRILAAGLAVMAAIGEQRRPVHPTDRTIDECKHVQFTAPGRDGSHARNAMAIHPGWFDRSPCGTGTCARMAQLHARGELAIGEDFVNESFIGTRFVGRLIGGTTVGDRPAVVPTVSGRAWITGMGQYLLDPDDPFPRGFVL
jgi:proline racemase